uniref:Protein Wnt n=1 Tax=Anopheles minimus TaxID=112268 RepID=A0A182WGH4_9DIPT
MPSVSRHKKNSNDPRGWVKLIVFHILGELVQASKSKVEQQKDDNRTNIIVQSLPDVRATCRTVPGLTRDQLELCYRASDVTASAIEGLELGVRECQYQFQWHRWNCSSLSTKSRNPHTSNMLKRGKGRDRPVYEPPLHNMIITSGSQSDERTRRPIQTSPF